MCYSDSIHIYNTKTTFYLTLIFSQKLRFVPLVSKKIEICAMLILCKVENVGKRIFPLGIFVT